MKVEKLTLDSSSNNGNVLNISLLKIEVWLTYSVNWFQVQVHNVMTAHRCMLCSLLTASVATTCQCNLLFRWSCFSSLLVLLGKKSEFLLSQMYIRKASLPQDFCLLWRAILEWGKEWAHQHILLSFHASSAQDNTYWLNKTTVQCNNLWSVLKTFNAFKVLLTFGL